jgi:predicted amidophosphoribosyltransferase
VRSDFLELLFPSRCFGCRVLGPKICTKCRQEWNPHFYIQTINGLKIFSAIYYSATARSILLGAKEDSLKEADRYIQDALIHCVQRAPGISLRELILIPIPSARRSIRRRGRDFLLEITENLASHFGIQTISALEITRKTFDQTKLDAINRHKNLLGAYRCSLSKVEIANLKNVILVDDLVTTGATLIEAKRALSAAGVHVTRAITACVAKPLR